MTKLIKLKEKFKISDEVKMIFTEITVFVLGFVLMSTKFIFGTYPFGIAYLCGLRKYTPFGFAGCLLSVVFLQNGDIVYLIALISVLGLRIASSLIQKKDKRIIALGEKVKNATLDSLFCENTEVRVAVSVLCAFGIGIYRVISTSYSYYEIFVLVFFSILVGMLTYALSISKKDKSLLGYGVICFALIYAMKDVSIFSLDVSIILGFGLTLYLSRYLGSVKSGSFGLLLGLCLSPNLAPIFGIGGLASGLLWGVSYYLAIMCAAILAIGYSVFVGGYSSLITVTPSVIFVSLLIYPLLRFKMLPVPDFIKNSTSQIKSIDTVVLKKNAERDKKQLSNLANAFNRIASIISGSQDKEKTPSRMNIHSLCVAECENYCYNCPKHFICWQNDVSATEENLNRLSQELFANGAVSKSCVTEKFLHRCPNIDLIISKINHMSKKKLENSVKNNKLEVTLRDYEQIAKLLTCVSEYKKNEEDTDVRLNERLCHLLAKIGLVFEEASIIGKESREIIITGINIERSKGTKEQLKEELELLLGTRLNDVDFIDDGDFWCAYVSVKPLYIAKDFSYSLPKSETEPNGDSFGFFMGTGSKKYTVLCDGMGSGSDASYVSLTCIRFLKEILSVTSDTEIALNMLSCLLRAKCLECSSTVDILEIDLNTGKGSITKCGASPTYVKRGDKIFKLQSNTMPLGILKDIDAEESSFELMSGDVCIMISDGVCDSKTDDKIMKLISDFKGNINTLPHKIIEEAKKYNRHSDDMTVCITELIS